MDTFPNCSLRCSMPPLQQPSLEDTCHVTSSCSCFLSLLHHPLTVAVVLPLSHEAAAAGKHVVVDVRRSIHADIVSLSTAVHLPLKQLCCASGVGTVVAAASGADSQALDV